MFNKKKVFYFLVFSLIGYFLLSLAQESYSLPRNPQRHVAGSFLNTGDVCLPLGLEVTTRTVTTVDSSELEDRRYLSLQVTGYNAGAIGVCISTFSSMTCDNSFGSTTIALAHLSTAPNGGSEGLFFETYSETPIFAIGEAGSSISTAAIRGMVCHDSDDDGDD